MKKSFNGKRFGRLIALYSTKTYRYYRYWLTVCDCGNLKEIRIDHLIKGSAKSCGCLALQIRTKHGYYKSSTYRSWNQMKQRCLNNKNPRWVSYGGRGIKICER